MKTLLFSLWSEIMLKYCIPLLAFFGIATASQAQTITDADEIVAQLRFWSNSSGDPVYYGRARVVNARTGAPGGHCRCLAHAFIKYEDGVFHLAYKMRGKSADRSCHYDDVTSREVDNDGIRVKDTNAGFGEAVGTALMTKQNIEPANGIFRTINTKTRRVGETSARIPPKGADAGLFAIRIDNGRIRVTGAGPLDYEVNILPQDPRHPPTVPVF
jgi:hypothetical protein